jgi:hypothetical protein
MFLAFTSPLFCVAASQEPRNATRDSVIQRQILAVENLKNTAMQKRNAGVLRDIYGDNLIFVNTSGHVLTKKDRMRSFEDGDVKYVSFRQGDYQIHVYGNTAVVNGSSCSVVNYRQRIIRSPRRFTTVYVKVDGKWRYVAHQATIVAQAKDYPGCGK